MEALRIAYEVKEKKKWLVIEKQEAGQLGQMIIVIGDGLLHFVSFL